MVFVALTGLRCFVIVHGVSGVCSTDRVKIVVVLIAPALCSTDRVKIVVVLIAPALCSTDRVKMCSCAYCTCFV